LKKRSKKLFSGASHDQLDGSASRFAQVRYMVIGVQNNQRRRHSEAGMSAALEWVHAPPPRLSSWK
jgi:hypothetical protein